MDLQNIFTWLWVGWLGLFGVLEGLALAWTKRFKPKEGPWDGGTLSELVWRLTKSNALIYCFFSVFWGWLTVHFLTGILTR